MLENLLLGSRWRYKNMVSIATMGKYVPIFRGGAPPKIIQEEVKRPILLITSVHYTKKKKDDKNPIKIIIKDVNY